MTLIDLARMYRNDILNRIAILKREHGEIDPDCKGNCDYACEIAHHQTTLEIIDEALAQDNP